MREIRMVAAVLGVAIALAGCGGSAGKSGEDAAPESSWVGAAALNKVKVYEDRTGDNPIHELRNPDANGTPLTFLVDGDDVDSEWVKVHLPVRPNGTTAYVKSKDLKFKEIDYAVNVDLGDRTLTVTKGDEVVLESPVAIGKEETPTPEGFFYIKELIKPEQPDTIYGAYAFGLSGHSEVIEATWDETEGAIAIHGTNDPDSIGEAISNGCLRVPDEVVTEMTTFIPLGTPVTIEG